ncbi:MAG: ChbG/HpnK family deacetylase [Thiohalocapsa sp.]
MRTANNALSTTKYLVINADDFGYYRCVSQGIVEAARAGVVSATSVMANRPGVDQQIPTLLQLTGIDVGVHLNITCGEPLTDALRARIPDTEMPGKFWWALRIPFASRLLRDVGDEWRAQITKCLTLGVDVRFLNSHEHVHMLPRLLSLVLELAQDFNIPFIRHSQPDWFYSSTTRSLVRNGLLQGLCAVQNRALKQMPMPRMFGMSASGTLNMDYLDAMTAQLEHGVAGELMCHPGLCDPSQISNPRVRAYHAWNLEYATLVSEEFAKLRERENVQLVRFSDLV